jgi:hypothetical protein
MFGRATWLRDAFVVISDVYLEHELYVSHGHVHVLRSYMDMCYVLSRAVWCVCVVTVMITQYIVRSTLHIGRTWGALFF